MQKICLIRPTIKDLVDKGLESWCSEFSINVQHLLSRVSSGKINVTTISEKELEKSDKWKDAGGFIFLLNASFLKNKEYAAFLKKLSDKISKPGKEDSATNIFKVNLSAYDNQALPDQLLQARAYVFYIQKGDQPSGEILNPGEGEYWPFMLDLAVDVQHQLESVQDPGKKPIETVKVFLAQTNPSQIIKRDLLRRELAAYGYKILPDMDLNFTPKELKSYIQRCADQSVLAIHIFGDEYGPNYPEAEKNIVELQFDFVTDYINAILSDKDLANQSKLERLIWMPPEISPSDEKQEQLINQLRRDIEKLHKTEIIQVPIELFKTIVVNKLKESLAAPESKSERKPGGKKSVYLIHDKSDEETAGIVEKEISSKGFEINKMNFDNGKASLFHLHKEYLIGCDAALVLYKGTSRSWLMSKMKDLLKAPGLGRYEPMKARGIVISGKDLAEDVKFPSEITVIREKDPVKNLKPFLDKLK